MQKSCKQKNIYICIFKKYIFKLVMAKGHKSVTVKGCGFDPHSGHPTITSLPVGK